MGKVELEQALELIESLPGDGWKLTLGELCVERRTTKQKVTRKEALAWSTASSMWVAHIWVERAKESIRLSTGEDDESASDALEKAYKSASRILPPQARQSGNTANDREHILRTHYATAIELACHIAGGEKELAEAADISERSVNRYLSKETTPDPGICRRISSETGVSLGALRPDLWGDGDE